VAEVQIEQDLPAITLAAAAITCRKLTDDIAKHGQATWVLAGGTAPALVYRVIAEKYAAEFDWQKIYVAMGDERCVPVGHPDSNWAQANTELLSKIEIPVNNLLRPPAELPAEEAARQYEQMLSKLPQKHPGIPRLDHLWLGMGEDGHTLSLFPGNPALKLQGALVVPVYDSPKPPPVRISLSLQALRGVDDCLIMVSGAGKAAIVVRALRGDQSLPIAQAVKTIEAAGGKVTWLLDTAAANRAILD
jgi:6-phosphogluconolactonase